MVGCLVLLGAVCFFGFLCFGLFVGAVSLLIGVTYSSFG